MLSRADGSFLRLSNCRAAGVGMAGLESENKGKKKKNAGNLLRRRTAGCSTGPTEILKLGQPHCSIEDGSGIQSRA